jgi:hypothetical protein
MNQLQLDYYDRRQMNDAPFSFWYIGVQPVGGFHHEQARLSVTVRFGQLDFTLDCRQHEAPG